MARVVVFDLDDTLIVEEAVARASMRAAVCAVAPDTDPAEAENVTLNSARSIWRAGPYYRSCRDLGIASWEGLWATFEGSHPSLEGLRRWVPTYRQQAWSKALAVLGVDGGPNAVSAASDAYTEAQRGGHRLVEGAAEVVRALAASVPVGLLTNGPADIQRLKLHGTGLQDCFRAVAISGEMGVGKPATAAFAQILDQLGVSPRDAVMVGDSWERDIQGALATGMSAVWITNGRPLPEPDAPVKSISQLGDISDPELLLRATSRPKR